MTYTPGNLSLRSGLIGGGAPRVWSYFTADSLATVLGSGYFSDADKKGLLLGDVVEVFAGTLNTALTSSPSTAGVGVVSRFSAAPAYAVCVVSAISSGAATITGMEKSAITDNSGGTANASTGIVAALSKYTAIIPIPALAGLANSQVRKLAIPHAFTLTSIGVRIGDPATTAAKAATLTAQIAGTPVTGGVVSLTSANATPAGALVAGTAITALNTGAAGDTVEAAVSSVTAFVEGSGHIELGITNKDLANAIATILAY